MSEKGLYVDLSQQEKYRKGKVAREILIPKPEKLVGGTEVYQKKGLPYWFCRIKGGRDEFMHLYTEDLSKHDVLYDDYGECFRDYNLTHNTYKFKEDLLRCVEEKPENGFVWIPVYEPSSDEKGEIQFVEEKTPLVGLSATDWEKIFENYSPENESQMAQKTTGFLLLLRWLKDGIASIMELAESSENIGHYLYSGQGPKLEKTGERFFGGLAGFVGNTEKLMREIDPRDKRRAFYQTSGSYMSFSNAVGRIHLMMTGTYDFEREDATGFMELKK